MGEALITRRGGGGSNEGLHVFRKIKMRFTVTNETVTTSVSDWGYSRVWYSDKIRIFRFNEDNIYVTFSNAKTEVPYMPYTPIPSEMKGKIGTSGSNDTPDFNYGYGVLVTSINNEEGALSFSGYKCKAETVETIYVVSNDENEFATGSEIVNAPTVPGESVEISYIELVA